MKIIILENIKGLGNKWDIKDVKDGYARNFLLPKKMAQIATKEAVMSIKKQKEEIGQHRDELKDAAEKAAKKFSGKEFHFYPEIGENNEVFGSISKKDIKEAIEKELDFLREDLRVQISKKIKVDLTRSLKELGIHEVKIKFGGDVEFAISAILNRDHNHTQLIQLQKAKIL